MLRLASRNVLKRNKKVGVLSNFDLKKNFASDNGVPAQADVVIIGGGIVGCSAAYHLSKKGIKAIVLEKGKITSGTTWHTAGLMWRLRPSDVEIRILESTRNLILNLEKETGIYPGWINNGGIFIARTEERMREYKRLNTLGHFYGIESQLLSPSETAQLSPILDPKKFVGGLYSPGDGVVDPTMFCNALIKGATSRGAQILENCPVTNILVDRSGTVKKVVGVETDKGAIKTGCVVNATGVWSRQITEMVGFDIPVTPLKHSYVVTDSIPEIKDTPNIRDHDGSVYFRIQGDSIYLGGYEVNPEVIKEIPNDFQFSLYELNRSIFDAHFQKATEICPKIAKVGIKSDVCGPESFTPDHKPIIGEDPRLQGFFQACGFNSGGIQLAAGCAEQLAIWISQGRPELPMFNYDIRRFPPYLREARNWITETSHESYIKNYSILYPHDQPLAGRNIKIDPFHEALVASGAVMEQAQGWERPGYFIKESTAPVRGYDWYGYYDHKKNEDQRYVHQLEGDYTFEFSKHFDLIGEEAMAARTNVALFDLSYIAKMYLTGPDAQEAADWLFTANTDREPERVVYTCALNSKGGVESDLVVTKLHQGVGTLMGPILKGTGFYIAAGGTSGYHAITHLKKEIAKKKFKSVITDITDQLGVLSIQGPKSGELLQSITESPITDERFPVGMSHIVTIAGQKCRAMRVSFVGELGYELHIPVASCIPIYNKVIEGGRGFEMKHAGFRALYSLSCEKGYHVWNYDLRLEDNPVEANLEAVCRKEGPYLGKQHVERLKQSGIKKRRCFFMLEDQVTIFGHETIWRDDVIVGYLRRGNYGYSMESSIGIGYVKHPKGTTVDNDYLQSGSYEIEVMGTKHKASLFLKSPFDPTNQRVLGNYEQNFQEQSHFED